MHSQKRPNTYPKDSCTQDTASQKGDVLLAGLSINCFFFFAPCESLCVFSPHGHHFAEFVT